MREKAYALAEWETVAGRRQPKLAVPLPAGASLMDATGQPAANLLPDPNVLLVECWAESDYLDSLGDDVIEREEFPGG